MRSEKLVGRRGLAGFPGISMNDVFDEEREELSSMDDRELPSIESRGWSVTLTGWVVVQRGVRSASFMSIVIRIACGDVQLIGRRRYYDNGIFNDIFNCGVTGGRREECKEGSS